MKSMYSALENAFRKRKVSHDIGLLKLIDDLISLTNKNHLNWGWGVDNIPKDAGEGDEEVHLSIDRKNDVYCSFQLEKDDKILGITFSKNNGVTDWYKFMLPEEYYNNFRKAIKSYYNRKEDHSEKVFTNLDLKFLKENENARFF